MKFELFLNFSIKPFKVSIGHIFSVYKMSNDKVADGNVRFKAVIEPIRQFVSGSVVSAVLALLN